MHFVIQGVNNSDVVLTTIPPVLATAALAPNQFAPLSAQVKVPAAWFFFPNPAQIYIVADAGNAVMESDETNNRSAPFTIIH